MTGITGTVKEKEHFLREQETVATMMRRSGFQPTGVPNNLLRVGATESYPTLEHRHRDDSSLLYPGRGEY